MRLDESLIAAAEREAAIQKRSIPKQIEFWAELGRAVEHLIGIDDAIAVSQGLRRIELIPLSFKSVAPGDVFDALESRRKSKTLSNGVTEAAIYYEASPSHPGFLDKVNRRTGERWTGRFRNGEFKVLK
jgi:hypothetical protein